MRNRRVRRRRYGSTVEKNSALRSLVFILCIAAVLFGLGKFVLQYFDAGNKVERLPVIVGLQSEGSAMVSINKSALQPAQKNQRLFAGDRIKTLNEGSALLTFFDGTNLVLASNSDINILESKFGSVRSHIILELHSGEAWLHVPEQTLYSGSIVRNVQTSVMQVAMPSQSEALIGERSLAVYEASGIGVEITSNELSTSIFIGEGQQFAYPNTAIGKNVYAYRSVLDTLNPTEFVQTNREIVANLKSSSALVTEGETKPQGNETALKVTEPVNNTATSLATITVQGRVNKSIKRVRVSGYNAPINAQALTFAQEIVLPDLDEIEVVIVALDFNDEVVSEVRRLVTRNRKPPEPPSITYPAPAGSTYQTSQNKLTIEGNAPNDTVGIVVNDYRLQLYNPGDRTWSYLASTAIDNLKEGENVYKVQAINKGGYKSDVSKITIILGNTEGILDPLPQSDATPETLPTNLPLAPGSLRVSGPTAGTVHIATGSSLLIEGVASKKTHSLWVNDYRLRLYTPGKTFWNYIADSELGTLKAGRNVYGIITRNEAGEILDSLRYTIQYQP